MDTGSNTSNAASSMKQAGKAISVTKGGLKHGILHSTVTKAIIGIVIAGSVGGAAVHYNQQKQDNVQKQETVKEEAVKKTAEKVENTVDSNDVNHNVYGITLDMVSGTDLVTLNTMICGCMRLRHRMVSMPENMLPLSERENSYLSGLVDLEIFQL